MMSPLDVSASAVDEIVNQKLDQIVSELEDQQIAYERKRREELKVLEQNKNAEIQRIKADAEEEMEYLKEKIKHEVSIKTDSKKKGVDETRKRQL
jgi:flagellar motor protein MotB